MKSTGTSNDHCFSFVLNAFIVVNVNIIIHKSFYVVLWCIMPPKKYTLPSELPDGWILTDSEKKKWRIGKIIGKGGFGLIYLGNGFNMSFNYVFHISTLWQNKPGYFVNLYCIKWTLNMNVSLNLKLKWWISATVIESLFPDIFMYYCHFPSLLTSY